MTTVEQRQRTIQQILDTTLYEHQPRCARQHPEQGQFVVTGPQMTLDLLKHVGFCVQVRRGCGSFGSDMVFLRHADGSLTTHENQAFYALTPEQETLAREVFEDLPETEDFSHGYRCVHKVHEHGFLVEGSVSPASPTPTVRITVQTNGGNGDASGEPSSLTSIVIV